MSERRSVWSGALGVWLVLAGACGEGGGSEDGGADQPSDRGPDEIEAEAGDGAEAGDPAALPLLHREDLTRLGAFRLPNGNYGDPDVSDSFAYGATGPAYHAAHGSLFLVGHDWNQWVAEVSIPEPSGAASFDELPVASVLQDMREITEGHLAEIGAAGAPVQYGKIGGLLVVGDALIGTAYSWYDAAIEAELSHFRSGLELAAAGDFAGMFKVGERNPGFLAGYMAVVPERWRALLGGPCVTGQAAVPIISRSSQGPALFAFGPAELSEASEAAAIWLVGYPQEHPTLGDWTNTTMPNPAYNMGSTVKGVVIPDGTRSVLFFGKTGLGIPCYGLGTDDPSLAGTFDPDGVEWCYDPVTFDKGTHAYPYVAYVWAYDALDLAAASRGEVEPWDVVPYEMWELDLPMINEAQGVQGATWDPARRRIFVTHMSIGDWGITAVTVLGVS
ncbi:MAG: hypothetical protein HY907_17165 [Deltaproteobacteria bacterium]|nr:hypothetical protein [Deltaproteobacteria bacterium]